MTISYEWTIDLIDEFDILDNQFFDSLDECIYFASRYTGCDALCISLVCYSGNDWDGEQARAYSPLIGLNFNTGLIGDFNRKIPKRFYSEVAKTKQKLK